MLRCLAIIGVLLLCSCADTIASLPARPDGQTIPLPTRDPSSLTEYVLDGSATDQRSAGAVNLGSALVLDATVSGFEYGVYRFNPGADSPDSVSVLLEEGVTTGAWIGLANYATGRWDFSGPFIKQKTLVVDDPAYVSPAGNIWVAVLAAANSATVNALSVRTIKPANQVPVAAFIPDTNGGNAPLTVQFDATGSSDADGTIIEYAWDFDGDGLYDGFSDTPLASHTFTTPGLFQVKLRVTDDQFARSTTTAGISVVSAGNQAPVAQAFAFPNEGEGPLNVTLNASGSYDPDGTIVVYDWDFDSDGNWDAYNTGPIVQHTFTTVGYNAATLRVTDNGGAQSTYAVQITVHGWLPGQIIQSGGSVGSYCSLAIVNGIPSISYYNQSTSTLQFKHAFDPNGDGWDLPQTIDNSGNVGIHTHMAIINGNPAVAYYDNTNAHPKFVRSADQDGVSWNLPITVDPAGVAGAFNSLATVNGTPAISYYVNGVNDLKYARAADAGGTSWNPPVTLDTLNDTGQYTSLAIVNGRPAVSYYNSTSGDLKYVRALDADGTTWATPILVDGSLDNVGQYTTLLVVNGLPAISYYDVTNQDVKYVRATDADGVGWDTPVVVDYFGDAGMYASMAIVNGSPAIAYAYFDVMSSADLKYVAANDADGASWGVPQTIDDNGNVGQYCSLNSNNGIPMVAYYDWGASQLRFIHYF